MQTRGTNSCWVQKLVNISQRCSLFSWQHELGVSSCHCPTHGMPQLNLVLDNQRHLFCHGRHFDQSSPRQTRMNLTQVHACNAEARLRLKHVFIYIQLQRIEPTVFVCEVVYGLTESLKGVVERDGFSSLPIQDNKIAFLIHEKAVSFSRKAKAAVEETHLCAEGSQALQPQDLHDCKELRELLRVRRFYVSPVEVHLCLSFSSARVSGIFFATHKWLELRMHNRAQ